MIDYWVYNFRKHIEILECFDNNYGLYRERKTGYVKYCSSRINILMYVYNDVVNYLIFNSLEANIPPSSVTRKYFFKIVLAILKRCFRIAWKILKKCFLCSTSTCCYQQIHIFNHILMYRPSYKGLCPIYGNITVILSMKHDLDFEYIRMEQHVVNHLTVEQRRIGILRCTYSSINCI